MRKIANIGLIIALLLSLVAVADGRTAAAEPAALLNGSGSQYPVNADAGKWGIAPETALPPVVDGVMDESFWPQAASLGDFRTTYYNQPVSDSPDYRIAYDETNLYIGGSFTQQEGESLAGITLLFRTPSAPEAYFTATIPVDSASLLNPVNWSPGESKVIDLQQNTLALSSYVLEEDEVSGDVTVEAAIPLSGFNLPGVLSAGDEWGVNIVHVHNNNTRPMISWMPIRTASYGDTALEPGGKVDLLANVADQGRFGSLIFGQLPGGEAPWTLSGWELDYVSFTEKQLSFELGGVLPPAQAQYSLSWIEPDGAVHELAQVQVTTEGGTSTIAFSHPAALLEGQYQLRISAYDQTPGDGGLAIVSFDRHSLIEAGNAMYVPASSGGTAVGSAPPSPQVQALLDLIPEQSGLIEVGLPEKPNLRPAQGMYTLSVDGQSLIAADTGTIYPNAVYPETEELTVMNRKGEPMTYPYYEDTEGKKYFLSAKLWYEQGVRAIAQTNALAQSDPLGAARALYKFAESFDGYVPMTNRGQNSYPTSPSSGPPYNMFSGNWNIWYINDLRSMKPLLSAYVKVKKTNAFEVLEQELGVDVERRIVEEMFIPTIDFALSMPVLYTNVDPYVWEGLIAAGKALDRPDYVHLAVEWMRDFIGYSFLADGFWKETALSYHSQINYFFWLVLNELQGYTDPQGYVSPRTGERFDNLDLNNAFPILQRLPEIVRELVYPDGRMLPLQDTWAQQTGTPYPDAGPLLLPSTGIGRLTLGEGATQSQLYMMFTPKNGHHHFDPLNLTLFAEGQELLPDLGYTYTNYAQFTLSTIAHNTVVVNGKNMPFNGATKEGGRIERFVPDGDLFRTMRASDPGAYAETSEYSREPWFIPFGDGDGSKGYVLDLFRVSGGSRHEYTLQGDANRDALFQTDMELEDYGPYLLPPGTQVQLPENYYDFGSAEGEYPGYIYVRDVKKAELAGDQFQTTLLTLDSGGREQAKLSITGLLEAGNNELFLGRSPSLRSTRLNGSGAAFDNNEEAEKYDMPKLVLRRSGTNLNSTFVTALEPYRGSDGPRIETIERLTPDQAPDGAVAVKVTYGGTSDIILSNPRHPEQPLVVGDMVLRGEFGMIRLTDGTVEKMELAGGTLLKKGAQALTGTGLIEGEISDTLRLNGGDETDALVTETEVPAAMAGRYVVVTHPDGSTSGFKLGDIREAQGKTILELADFDPGLQFYDDGSSGQPYYPAKRWNGTHTFAIADREAEAGIAQPALPTGTLTGTVYGPDALPLSGASVHLAGYAAIQAVTDNAGQFVFSAVPAGEHRVVAFKAALSRAVSSPFQVTEGGTASVSVALADKTAPAWVDVAPQTSMGNAPVAGIGLGDTVTATVSEAGYIYVVPPGTLPTVPALEAAIGVGGAAHAIRQPVAAGVPAELNTRDFSAGSYVMYAVDEYGNVSNGFLAVIIPTDLAYIDSVSTLAQYSGVWRTLANGAEGADSIYYGGSQAHTLEAGAYVDVPFYGSVAQVIASRNVSRGKIAIYVDGVYKQTIDLYSTAAQYQQVVFETGHLTEGMHVIRIQATGEVNPATSPTWAWFVFDAVRVLSEEQLPPELSGVTGGPLVSGAGVAAESSKDGMLYLVPASTPKTEAAITAAASGSGGSSTAAASNVTAMLSTTVLSTGVYRVYAIDAIGNISAGSSPIAIFAPGEKIDNTNAVVQYTGAWSVVPNGGEGAGSNYYGGSQAHTRAAGAYADIPFYGTGAQVLASRNVSRGKAAIYVDGVFKEKVDLYNATPQYNQVVFDTGDLEEGMHTIRIEATGERNASADPNWSWVVFDALQPVEALPDTTPPTAVIAYSHTDPTGDIVVATLTPSEDVTITNNGGQNSYTFLFNGSFTFEFKDAAGNPGTATAIVSNIVSSSTGVPAKPELSDDNGHDTGIMDGQYNVKTDLWWGNNGKLFKLYENGVLIDTRILADHAPQAQSVVVPIGGKPNGTYVYYAELTNAFGTTRSDDYMVVVTQASPGQPILSHNNWDGDGNFSVVMNMWWGTNGTTYRLFENGVLIDTKPLTAQSPQAQSAATAIHDRPVGVYEYEVELVNDAGTTVGEPLVVHVTK